MNPTWQQFPAVATLAAAIPFGTLLHQPAPTDLICQHAPGGDLKLFCFQPATGTTNHPRPAAIWIHGGGWTGGTCESFFPMARYTAARGLVSFVVQYRLVKPGGTTIQDSIADCKSAVRYVRGHAAQLGVDPHRIGVIGESAGGHLAACVATLAGPNAASDDMAISAEPDALVLYNPLTDFTQSAFAKLLGAALNDSQKEKLARELSPVFHVRSGLPPTLVVHGLADTVIAPDQSRRFAEAMRQAGNRCDLVMLSDTPHAFLIPDYKCSEAVVVHALRLGDEFLTSLGYCAGKPTLVASDPPAWKAKWPPPMNSK